MYTNLRGRWLDLDDFFREPEAVQRQFERFLGADAVRAQGTQWGASPEPVFLDEGSEYVVTADVPGLAATDIELQATASGITLAGARRLETPAGYKAHRSERGSYRFARTFTFPVKIDADHIKAEVLNGILTLRVPKAAEIQPKRISVTG